MRSPLLPCAAALVASVLVYAPGCSDNHAHDDGVDPNAGTVYEAGTNDEALVLLLAAKATTDETKGASFSAPAPFAELPGATPPTFRWRTGTTAMSLPRRAPEPTQRWSDLVGVERAAHAHGDPVNGRTYFVVFATPSDPKLVRVFTMQTSFTPDVVSWDKLRNAGAPITATITTAVFDNNKLVQDGGPFVGPSITFTVKP